MLKLCGVIKRLHKNFVDPVSKFRSLQKIFQRLVFLGGVAVALCQTEGVAGPNKRVLLCSQRWFEDLGVFAILVRILAPRAFQSDPDVKAGGDAR